MNKKEKKQELIDKFENEIDTQQKIIADFNNRTALKLAKLQEDLAALELQRDALKNLKDTK